MVLRVVKFGIQGNNWHLFIDNYYNNNAANIYFRTKTAGTPVNAITILGSGNVGIGTTSPGVKLEVNGAIAAAGGSANHAICWKADGKTLGYCSAVVDSNGACGTCN